MSELYAQSIEQFLIKKFISEGDIVFDVGAFLGLWSELALLERPRELHLFEPSKKMFDKLMSKFSNLIDRKQVFISNEALFSERGFRDFYFYSKNPSLSTVYRRLRAEKKYGFEEPEPPVQISTTTIDEYCKDKGVERIDYLKIDVEGAELDVIIGASKMLSEGRINVVEFEYGETYLDAKITLKSVYDFLMQCGYKILRAGAHCCQQIQKFESRHENYEYTIFVAVYPLYED